MSDWRDDDANGHGSPRHDDLRQLYDDDTNITDLEATAERLREQIEDAEVYLAAFEAAIEVLRQRRPN